MAVATTDSIMEDKVTQFGNIANNLVDRIENAVEAISRIDGCKDVFLASKANADLGCLERACMKGLRSPWVVEGTLLNLAEIGMCGCIFETDGMKANALANQMTDLYARKNRDYGNSFDRSMDKFGLVVAAIRIGDKVNRLQSLVAKRGEAEVKDESLADTFMDLACYSIMTMLWLHDKKEK